MEMITSTSQKLLGIAEQIKIQFTEAKAKEEDTSPKAALTENDRINPSVQKSSKAPDQPYNAGKNAF